MTTNELRQDLTVREIFGYFIEILRGEREFYLIAIIYGIAISLLSLATPVSVQFLINTVNTGLTTPLVVLSLTLFGLLLASGLFNALRVHLMEIFGRKFYARQMADITMRAIYAQNPFFNDESRGALFNRYFDIIVVQKNIPVLLIGGFTVVLQGAVGFVLVSLYHPLFLAFNLVTVFMIWLVWAFWGNSAIQSAVELSHRKHAAAAWLQSLGDSDGFFKSEHRISFALEQSERRTADYVHAHRTHFRRHYAQTLAFLVLYAAASAILLGLGGWLVIQGQLTLGQLVAAELVLSAVFFGVSQLGTYLNYFYDLAASIEELSMFSRIALEAPTGALPPERKDTRLEFVKVRGDARGHDAVFDFTIPAGAKLMAGSASHGLQRLFSALLKRHVTPTGGYLAFGGVDILATELQALRREVYVFDRPTFIEMTIREYLTVSANGGSPQRSLAAIEAVGLGPAIAKLGQGLDTRLATTGFPLSTAETMQLRLAAAIVSQPRVLILNQLFDMIDEDCLSNALEALSRDEGLTLIYFSNRRRNPGFGRFLYLDYDQQFSYDNFEAFMEKAYATCAPTRGPLRLLPGPEGKD